MNRRSSTARSSCSRRSPRFEPHPIRHRAMDQSPADIRCGGFYSRRPASGQHAGCPPPRVRTPRSHSEKNGGDIQATTKVVDCRSLTSSPPNLLAECGTSPARGAPGASELATRSPWRRPRSRHPCGDHGHAHCGAILWRCGLLSRTRGRRSPSAAGETAESRERKRQQTEKIFFASSASIASRSGGVVCYGAWRSHGRSKPPFFPARRTHS